MKNLIVFVCIFLFTLKSILASDSTNCKCWSYSLVSKSRFIAVRDSLKNTVPFKTDSCLILGIRSYKRTGFLFIKLGVNPVGYLYKIADTIDVDLIWKGTDTSITSFASCFLAQKQGIEELSVSPSAFISHDFSLLNCLKSGSTETGTCVCYSQLLNAKNTEAAKLFFKFMEYFSSKNL